jgi:hydrogenase-4 component F
MLAAIILVPVLLGITAFFLPLRQLRRYLLVAGGAAHLIMVVSMFVSEPSPLLAGWLMLDRLGLFFLAILSLLFLFTSIYSLDYLAKTAAEHEGRRRDPERIFVSSLLFFLATMTLVTLSHHLGLLWVAVEATTLASAPLIFFHRSVQSLEATWKYLLICSVGIALALFGTFFMAAAASNTGREMHLTLSRMIELGGLLDARLLRIAFIFLLVGYGTKMGLAPMHTWLPDAHSEAPSVVSSLLSGVLLNCAFLAVLRIYQICLAAGQDEFARNILVIFGLFSMLLAAVFILHQPNYKRMLAYSSVEHMGILALGIGMGPAAVFYTLFHALNHSLTKGMMFLTAGNILSGYKTKSSAEVNGLLRQVPVTGALWIGGFLAITGTPLFGMFISEFNLLGIAVHQNSYLIAILFLFFLTVIFIGMGKAVLPMAQGTPNPEHQQVRESATSWLPPLILLLLTFMLGIYIPDWLNLLLSESAMSLGGAR